MTRTAPRAVLVLSGNELLDGRTPDSNGAWASADLSRRGAKVLQKVTVADDAALLTATLAAALAIKPDVLLIGGGLGTTHDDFTAECLARVLEVPLEENATALALLEDRVRSLAERRRLDFEEVFALARRQARLPAGCTPVPPAGIAPGIAARRGRSRIYALPGVPFEFKAMWLSIAERLEDDGLFPDVRARTIRIYGVGELQVAPLFEALPRDLLELGINVGGGEVTVRMRYTPSPAAEAQAGAVAAALREGAPVFSDDGRTVDEMVAEGLHRCGGTLAVAESCTGGLLGARVTAAAGSSEYFLGGVISYADQVKEKQLAVPADALARFGAVSEPVAAAMATGVRDTLGADYGLSITGVAGPAGGTPEKPVGLVYVACAGPKGVVVRELALPGDRDSVRRYAATAALHLLRRNLTA